MHTSDGGGCSASSVRKADLDSEMSVCACVYLSQNPAFPEFILGQLRENFSTDLAQFSFAQGPMLESIIQYCKGPFTEQKQTVKNELLTIMNTFYFEFGFFRILKPTILLLSLLICPEQDKTMLVEQLQTTPQKNNTEWITVCRFELEVLDYLRSNLVCDLKDREMRENTETIRHMFIDYWKLCGADLALLALSIRPDVLRRNFEYLVDCVFIEQRGVSFPVFVFVLVCCFFY